MDETTQPAAPSAPEPAADARPPADPEKRARDQKAREARKLIKAVSDAKSADAFWEKVSAAAEKHGKTVAAPKAAPGAAAPAAAPLVDPVKAAKFEPGARQFWEGVQMALSAASEPFPMVAGYAAAMAVQTRTVLDAEKNASEVKLDPVAMLAQPTAECAALWLPEEAAHPAAKLGGLIALFFGPPTVALVFSALQARAERKGEEPEQTEANEKK